MIIQKLKYLQFNNLKHFNFISNINILIFVMNTPNCFNLINEMNIDLSVLNRPLLLNKCYQKFHYIVNKFILLYITY